MWEAVEHEPSLFTIQRRIEIAQGRVAMLARRLDLTPPSPYRVRLLMILRWATHVAKLRQNALQYAIEEWGNDR